MVTQGKSPPSIQTSSGQKTYSEGLILSPDSLGTARRPGEQEVPEASQCSRASIVNASPAVGAAGMLEH